MTEREGPGQVEAIWLKRARSGVMDPVPTAVAHVGRGLVGSILSGRTRQITLIEREVWELLMRETGGQAPASARRANLLVSGIALANSRGRVLKVGSVRLEVAGETKPCERMEEAVPGLQGAMRRDWRGGVYARVLDAGVIAIGDTVEWDPGRPTVISPA